MATNIYFTVIVSARVRGEESDQMGAPGSLLLISSRSHQGLKAVSLPVLSLGSSSKERRCLISRDAATESSHTNCRYRDLSVIERLRRLCCSFHRYLQPNSRERPLKSNGLLQISSASQLKTFQLFVDGSKVKWDYLYQFLNHFENAIKSFSIQRLL